MNPISELFAVGPFRCLHDHASEAKRCLGQLRFLFEAALSNDGDAVAGHLSEIQSRVLLSRAFVDEAYQLVSRQVLLPVGREDIISTIDALNLIVSTCGDVAPLISAHSMSLPDDTRQQLAAYVRESLELSIMATDLITRVNVLVEVCFDGPEVDKVESCIDEVRLHTTRTTLLHNRLLQTQFSKDGDACPLDHSFCMNLITQFGRIVGLSEQLTRRFHLFIRRRSPDREPGRIASAFKRWKPASVSSYSAASDRATHSSRTA